MIAIGVGCRKNCPEADIIALIRETLACLPSTSLAPSSLFTMAEKRDEHGLQAAARTLGLPLVYLDREVLELAAPGASCRSRRVDEMFGLPSVAETAALAGAGRGAVLLVPRRTSPTATCAVAQSPLRSQP